VRRLSQQAAFLWLVLAFGVFGRDSRLVAAAAILLGLRLLPNLPAIALLERTGIDIGITFLSLAVLAPIARGRGPINLVALLASPQALLAVAGGIVASWVCARGVTLLRLRPEATVGLIIGSILGASLLGGIPVGPLFAAGLAWVFLRLLGLSA
jgi:uncharacterized membrane protein (DUF441 family)